MDTAAISLVNFAHGRASRDAEELERLCFLPGETAVFVS